MADIEERAYTGEKIDYTNYLKRKEEESMGSISATAKKGNHFVLAEYGYAQTREEIRHERAVGKPVGGFEHEVPASWARKGYVEEVKEGAD